MHWEGYKGNSPFPTTAVSKAVAALSRMAFIFHKQEQQFQL